MKRLLNLPSGKLEELIPIQQVIEKEQAIQQKLLTQLEASRMVLNENEAKAEEILASVEYKVEAALHKVEESVDGVVGKVEKVVDIGRRTRKRAVSQVRRQRAQVNKAISKRKKAVKRIAQPTMSSLVVEILKDEQGGVLTLQQIADKLLKEKGYKTRSKNVSNSLGVMLYQNRQGLFKKAGPGKFTLAKKKGR